MNDFAFWLDCYQGLFGLLVIGIILLLPFVLIGVIGNWIYRKYRENKMRWYEDIDSNGTKTYFGAPLWGLIVMFLIPFTFAPLILMLIKLYKS